MPPTKNSMTNTMEATAFFSGMPGASAAPAVTVSMPSSQPTGRMPSLAGSNSNTNSVNGKAITHEMAATTK